MKTSLFLFILSYKPLPLQLYYSTSEPTPELDTDPKPEFKSEPKPEPIPEPIPQPQTVFMDLQTLCGEWPVSNSRETQCVVLQTETGEYQITVSKTDPWTGQHEVLGPLVLQAVSETCAEASYEEDGLGHRGIIQIGITDNLPYLQISAENNGSGSYDDFTFEMSSHLLRPEDIEEERHIELENLVTLYVTGLASAITERNFLRVESYLLEDSEIYRMQKDLVIRYAKRGISEDVKDVSIMEYEKIDDTMYRVLTNETIHVGFADGRGKTVEQSYWYTAVQRDGQWLLTDMEEV